MSSGKQSGSGSLDIKQEFEAIGSKTETMLDDTVHYMSPASMTATTMIGEDTGPGPGIGSSAFLQYLRKQSYGFAGEYSRTSVLSTVTVELPKVERTLCIIKPDAVYYEDVVIRKITKAGFTILNKRKLHLTPEQVSELYKNLYGQLAFPYLVVSVSTAPVIVMCLAAFNAVEKWKDLVRNSGILHQTWFCPKSIRLRFGLHETMENVLHASEDFPTACKDVRFFFPKTIIEPLLHEEAKVTDFLNLYVNKTLVDGLTELCKKKPIEPILYLAEWLLLNNPYQPNMAPEIAKLPT